MGALMDTVRGEPRPLTVEEYYRVWEGKPESALEERTELINGVIFHMPPIGIPHAGVVGRLGNVLGQSLGERAYAMCQSPLLLDQFSEPQPDFSVLRFEDHYYMNVRPTAEHALLVIEVSHTTYRQDRDIKIPLYARHGIPEVWIFDLQRRNLQIFSSLEEGAYQDVLVTGDPGVREISSLPGVPIDLSWFRDFPVVADGIHIRDGAALPLQRPVDPPHR